MRILIRNYNKSELLLKVLTQEFFELFSEEDFSREDADLILNSFFEILDSEIEKDPELRDDLKLYLAKQQVKLSRKYTRYLTVEGIKVEKN